jgi:hypothetical protein
MSDENASPRSGGRRRLDLVSLGIALGTMIAAVVVPIYLFTVTEQNAVLSLRYIANQALVNIDPRSTKNVKVTYDGVEVKSPWLISSRLENIGNIPIENKDIYDRVTLIFADAIILRI